MNITDEKLYYLCKKYGEIARKYRDKFAGLLPEVYERRLYERKGFESVFHFAKVLCGMSEDQVRRILNLGKKFEPVPMLHGALINGEVSVNKLARVASIATLENEAELANQVKLLSKSALETLVRDEKFTIRNGSPKPENEPKSVPGHTQVQQNSQSANAALQLRPEIQAKLLALQQKGIDINELLLEFLQKREEDLAARKKQLAADAKPTASRYIPVVIKEVLAQEFGTKCSIDTCTKDAQNIHHGQRHALSQNHNPFYLAPLCKPHHEIAHSIDVKFHEAKMRAVESA